ncbi:PrsW family glutamic-type intramembrane protease [Curtobacterium sp. UCD-KPL2560]|uniref:PrsW family intramembrane metalloprotease n=1 Tax=Curtobacterium sp. UCD-KPL2560 TaxID=1885315 RepID=UPI0008267B00|nr:PrsW family glutamic-type intramembrane protease [Curtobacterium sp. UCD-KPL2560]
MTTTTDASVHPHHRHGWWWKTLLAGAVLWAVTVVVTVLTLNTNLVPTIILLGSFLVPFTVVLFVIERVTGTVSTMQLVTAFFVGGVLGVLGASLLEADLRQDAFVYVVVGFVEELVKGVLLLVVGWRVRPKTARQGALLGATIGAGFAAFESAGYAFNAAITQRGIDLVSLLQTEVVRAVLSPVGHVLWTAILGAVLFGAARGGERLRWSWSIPVAYVGVALLHGLWDSNGTLSTVLAFVLTGTPLSAAGTGAVPPTLAGIATTLYVVGLLVVTLIGVAVLVWLLVSHRHRDRALLERAQAERAQAAVGGPSWWAVAGPVEQRDWEATPRRDDR